MIDLVLQLFLSGLLLVAAGGTGQFLLAKFDCSFTNKIEELSFSLVLGWGVLIFLVLLLGCAHLLYPWTVNGVVIFLVLLSGRGLLALGFKIKQHLGEFTPDIRSLHFWLLILVSIGIGFNLLRALAPPHGATDPLAYQLALPKLFLQKHSLSFERTINGALYPTNMGLLFLVGMSLKDGILSQVIHWLTGVLCALAVWGFGTRYFNYRGGMWGGVVFVFVPIVSYFSPLGYIDVGLCYFQFMAFWALFNWGEKNDLRSLILAGILTGLAMGVKHQGLTTAFLGGGYIVFASLWNGEKRWSRACKNALIFGAVALLIVSPWYIRSYLWTGNPIWPLANSLFKGLAISHPPTVLGDQGALIFSQSFLAKIIPSLAWFRGYWDSMSLWSWSFTTGEWQKAIGGYFIALLPGILLYVRNRKHWFFVGFCLVYYLVLVRFLHMNPRYGLVLFAFLSVLCGYVVERVGQSKYRIIPFFLNGALLATFVLNIAFHYYLAKPIIQVATGGESQISFLRRTESNFRAYQFINQNLPQTATIFFQGIVKGYYCERPYLWGDHAYNGIVDYREFDTPEQLLDKFRELNVSHVFRMNRLPPMRVGLYPDYFADAFHEAFRKQFLKPIYWDETYVLFEVMYSG